MHSPSSKENSVAGKTIYHQNSSIHSYSRCRQYQYKGNNNIILCMVWLDITEVDEQTSNTTRSVWSLDQASYRETNFCSMHGCMVSLRISTCHKWKSILGVMVITLAADLYSTLIGDACIKHIGDAGKISVRTTTGAWVFFNINRMTQYYL